MRGKMTNNNNIKITTWNTNSIYFRINELEEFLLRDCVDVCFISETRLSHKSTNVKFSNYNCYRKDRLAANNGEGVILLISEKFNTSEKCIVNPSINSITNMEVVAVKLYDIPFAAAYLPLQKKLVCDEITKILFCSSKVLIGGDIYTKYQA